MALAASSRIREAYEALLGKHHNSSGGSVEAAAESAATRTVDRLVLEIENDRVVRSDVSVELDRRVQRVGSDLHFAAASGYSLSIKTVEKHRRHLMSKLDIHDTAGLTRYAIAAGIIESGVRLKIE